MAEVERLGGAVAAIETGFYQQLIADEAYAQGAADRLRRGRGGRRQRVRRRHGGLEPERFDVPPHLESEQREKLARLRERRDGAAVATRLAALEEAARGQDNLMPAILDAVRAEATLGEVCGALRTAFGEYRPAAAALI